MQNLPSMKFTASANPIRAGADGEAFANERRQMVQSQLRARGIHSAPVLDAMLAVPRHEFVPAVCREEAYTDQALPIAFGQTISQPLMVAAMSEALALTGAERVLEIGTGTGYQTAVLSRLASEVFSIEVHGELATTARDRLQRLGCANVRMRVSDGGLGWPEAAPFDAILVAAAAPSIPPPLFDQLAEAGRLVIPLGAGPYQELLLVHKREGKMERRRLYWCRFVPLVGIHGWGRPTYG
jgi:protein-L-isoaspartate(D-aspartate) O-methyltransferase